MGRFYVKTRKGAARQGPFSSEQLKALAAGGKLKPDYLVSKDGGETWYLAGNITDLPRPKTAPAPRPPGSPAAARRPMEPRKAVRSAVSALAEQVEVVRREGPVRKRRFPLAAVAGVVLGLGTAGVVAYAFFASDRAARNEDANASAAVAPGAVPGQRDKPPAESNGEAGHPVPPAPEPRPTPPVPPARPAPAPPVPVARPDGNLEPSKFARSFQIVSVAYGGQSVRAMGSELTFHLTNRTDQTIQSAKGHVWLYDPDGVFLTALPVELDEPVPPGGTVPYSDVWMALRGPVYGLLDRAAKQMKFRFAAAEVTYEGGQVEKID